MPPANCMILASVKLLACFFQQLPIRILFSLSFIFKKTSYMHLGLLCEKCFSPHRCQQVQYRLLIWTLVVLSGIWVFIPQQERLSMRNYLHQIICRLACTAFFFFLTDDWCGRTQLTVRSAILGNYKETGWASHEEQASKRIPPRLLHHCLPSLINWYRSGSEINPFLPSSLWPWF